jgi:DNA invertase Pin-like site-specific DNA recombinase
VQRLTGAFAEFERSMIRQRVKAGLKRAAEAGKQLGRPRISAELEKRIQDLLRAKKGMLGSPRSAALAPSNGSPGKCAVKALSTA